jgi:SAM-dependent methyltransferase
MKIADQVRQIYERRPYPFGNDKALKRRTWGLIPEWVDALGRSEARNFAPRRVLVAGCGDGTEAFNLRRQFPRAEIVAVDFSVRSLAIARRLQRRAGEMRRIRFVAADLADRRLPARLGGGFDLITCHGVLSYISQPVRALKNFARCLTPEGILYLGVNGSAHVSTRLRQALPGLGFDLNHFRDSPHLRRALRLCDAILVADGLPGISAHPAGYLAGDVFGALNQSLALSQWVSLGRRAGLSFRGNWASLSQFRKMAEDDFYAHLIPRSRAQVASFLEQLAPSQFHRLLFSRAPDVNPPWESRARLLKWTIARTRLYEIKLPKPGKMVRDRLRAFTIASPVLKLSTEWHMPEWELELLRCADRGLSLASLLAKIPLSVPFPELRKQLYLLYQLGIINLTRMHHAFVKTDASACTRLASSVQGDLSRLTPTKSALQGTSLMRGSVSDAG